MTETDDLSPAMSLVRIVRNGCREFMRKTHRSNIKFDHCLEESISLAIRYGVTFARGDFQQIYGVFNPDSWRANEIGEKYYTSAVETRNMSACHSFETWKKRKPFIFDGKRIYVHRQFIWNQDSVTCTSFARDGSYLTACSYRVVYPKEGEEYSRKIHHRYRITHEDIRAAKKVKKTSRNLL